MCFILLICVTLWSAGSALYLAAMRYHCRRTTGVDNYYYCEDVPSLSNIFRASLTIFYYLALSSTSCCLAVPTTETPIARTEDTQTEEQRYAICVLQNNYLCTFFNELIVKRIKQLTVLTRVAKFLLFYLICWQVFYILYI